MRILAFTIAAAKANCGGAAEPLPPEVAPGLGGAVQTRFSRFVPIRLADRATDGAIGDLLVARRWRFALAAATLLAAGAPRPPLAQSDASPNPRIALVIGESTYADETLATSVNDAALIAQTLQAAGFDVVGARDLDASSVREAMRDFLAKAAAIGPDMQAFVYLAGRGVQYEGENFFVPVDAEIVRDSDTSMEAVRLSDFTHALAAEPGRARIVVLDAARANPYVREGQPLAGGLALVEPDEGELIAFNTAPGSIAGDEPGPYGAFAKTLAGAMRQGGFPFAAAFTQTRVQVNAQTGGALVPWSASKLAAPYYVFERADDAPVPPAIAALAAAPHMAISGFPPDRAYPVALARDTLAGYAEFLAAFPDAPEARRVRAILAARREALFWRRAVAQDTPEAYRTYLARYPGGPHVADTERRLAILAALAQPPTDFAPLDYADLPPPPEDEIADASRSVYVFSGPEFGLLPPPPPAAFDFAEDDDWRAPPPPAPPIAVGVLPALSAAIPLAAGARAYRDAGRRDGRALPGPPPTPPATPLAPPPLPGGIKPYALVKPSPNPAPDSSPLSSPLGKPRGLPAAGEAPLKAFEPEPRVTPPRRSEHLACGKPGMSRCPG
jgi:uncharacterized caspase-like protein